MGPFLTHGPHAWEQGLHSPPQKQQVPTSGISSLEEFSSGGAASAGGAASGGGAA